MSVLSNDSVLFQLQQRITVLTWITTVLLSLRGLFEFYGYKNKGDFELFLITITEPIVSLFRINQSGTYIIPALDVFYAVLTVAIAGLALRAACYYIERFLKDLQVLLAWNMLAFKKVRR
jgi:uncharacterized protein YggT (Ycf19 family)